MNNKILPKSSEVTFEPHTAMGDELPFIFHTDRPRKNGRCNIHENVELLYVTDGSGQVRYDGKRIPISEGDIVVINSYSVHDITTEQTIEYHCLIIDNGFCEENNIAIKQLSFQPLIRDAVLCRLFDHVVEEYRQKDAFRCAGIKSAVLDMLVLLCRKYSTQSQRAPLSSNGLAESIYLTMEYIKKNIQKKLTLDDIAVNIGFSKFYFAREFKKMTGFTLVQYINTVRCECAENLLKSGKYTVKEAAVMAGFENFSYFASVFKKYTSLLPSEYLKKHL